MILLFLELEPSESFNSEEVRRPPTGGAALLLWRGPANDSACLMDQGTLSVGQTWGYEYPRAKRGGYLVDDDAQILR